MNSNSTTPQRTRPAFDRMTTLVKGEGPGVIGDSENRVFAWISPGPSRPTNEDVDALANYVIRAVNSHADLLAALRFCLPALEWSAKNSPSAVRRSSARAELKFARDAIAKAEGTK